LTTITKGPNTTAEEFEWNLLLCDQLTDWSPGTTPVLTADELKQKPSSMECHIRGLPSPENQAKINISRQVMLAHMHDCQKESNAKQMKNMLKQQKKKNPSNGGRGQGRSDNCSQFCFGSSLQNVKPCCEASTAPMNSQDDDHQCHEHADKPHLWGDCFLHPVTQFQAGQT
jgi:hypothetical protein